MKRVVVTGSEGFIGKNLCPYLSKRGIEVIGFDLKSSKKKFPDLHAIDAVIHLGANSSTTEKDLKKILNENFIFSGTLYQMCANMGVKFQYASSASVYGLSETFEEDQFCTPLSPYAYSKYMFDNWLLNEDHPYQGFRYFNVYGPHEEGKGDQASPITKFIKQVQEDGEIKVFRTKASRDFVNVEDVCEVHYRMLHHDDSGIYNVGTGNSVSFKDIADKMAENSGAKVKQITMPSNLKGQYQKFTKADITKLTSVIGEMEWKQVLECI
jgi:ADP-L-glycero-D-manno-heptose 6-epimerase